MTNRVLIRTAIAGVVAITTMACDGDFVSPDGVIADGPVAKQGPPGETGGGKTGDLYSDLLILFRDANGLPIVYEEPFVDEHDKVSWCVQPVTDERVPNPLYVLYGEGETHLPQTLNAISGRMVTLIPLFAHFQQFLPIEVEEAGVTILAAPEGKGPPDGKGGGGEDEESAPGPCEILVLTDAAGTVLYDASVYANEVDLARLNLVRSPEHVLRKQMDEVELLFTSTNPNLVTLEAAGRFLFDGTIVDAAPKLQGIREALLETGTIPGATSWNGSEMGYPFPFRLYNAGFQQWDNWAVSAFALAGAASKFTPLSIDAVPYHDRVMGTAGTATSPTWAPVLTQPQLGERFVDYSGFTYDRDDVFQGCVTLLDLTGQWIVVPYVGEYNGVPSKVKFTDFGPDGPATTNVAGYAQMAEDTRAVIYFLHLYSDLYRPVSDPVGMNTCAAQTAALITPAP